MAVNDLTNLSEDFDRMRKYYEDYYSRPLYVNPNNPNTIINMNNTNQSPRPLSPPGSGARVIDRHREERTNPYVNENIETTSLNMYADQNSVPDFSKINNAFSSPEPIAPLGSNARVIEGNANEFVSPSGIEMKPMDIDGDAISDATSKTITDNSASLIKEKKGGMNLGGKASSIARFAGNAYGSIQGTDASKKESWAKTGNLTVSGASTGAQIGGPWGAAIGAVVGLGAGMINMGADTRKRNAEKREKLRKESNEFDKKVKDSYEIENAERELELLRSFSKSQLNYLK